MAASAVKWAVVIALGVHLGLAVAVSVAAKIVLLVIERRRAKNHPKAKPVQPRWVVRFERMLKVKLGLYWAGLLTLAGAVTIYGHASVAVEVAFLAFAGLALISAIVYLATVRETA